MAEYLKISYQAVSKWENGTAYPDITLIPTIANFFRVTTDTLFSMDDQINSERLKEIEEKVREKWMNLRQYSQNWDSIN